MTTSSRATSISIPPEMAAVVKKAAEGLELTESELVTRILGRYLTELRWNEMFRYGQERGRASGYGPEDIPRLVEEIRAEMAAEQV